MGFKNNFLLYIIFMLIAPLSVGQITHGKITFERKTNLYKKYTDEGMREWIKEENKNKTDFFELYFNDTFSVFKPKESELKESMSWTTQKNTVFQNFKSGRKFSIKEIWGEKLFVTDTLTKRTWKITNSKRTICGFKCRKAIWQVNDSTRIYAWYSNEIMLSTGPESFNGLPGTILGLASEDGGVVYFAKSVEQTAPTPEDLAIPKSKNIYTTPELRSKLEKDFGKQSWGKEMIKETFDVW